jgi:shikimate dehydrogenase
MPDVWYAGLIGQPLGHSRSPAMQQAAFDALGIPARYVLWETAPGALAARVATLRTPAMLGANVTIPYKTAVLPLLDDLDATARRAGAVNTIVRSEDESGGVRLIGHNSDVAGLRRALAEADAWRAGRDMLLLGAGGAARAALAVARLEGAAVTLAARRVDAGWAAIAAAGGSSFSSPSSAGRGVARGSGESGLAATDTGRRGDEAIVGAADGCSALPWAVIAVDDTRRLAAALEHTALLINATPVGMSDPQATPIPPALLARMPADAFVFDLVYAPPETALVRAARARGLRASGGLPMLLYQGAEAFTLWTGQPAPVEVMRAALGN